MSTTKTNQITIICDNGGGITLQIVSDTGYRFQHTYDDAAYCAADIREAVGGFDFAEAEGNEAEGDAAYWLEPTSDEIRNGGYRIFDLDAFKAIDPENTGWRNVRELHRALQA